LNKLRNATAKSCAVSILPNEVALADWPENVRELQSEFKRAVASAGEGETIATGHLSPTLRATKLSVVAATDIVSPTEEITHRHRPAKLLGA
jgi:transcriptional regulator of acetoin/glycerol metabolism